MTKPKIQIREKKRLELTSGSMVTRNDIELKRLEYEDKQRERERERELRQEQLLRDGVITFEQYERLLKIT